jgi:hypothetical protein
MINRELIIITKKNFVIIIFTNITPRLRKSKINDKIRNKITQNKMDFTDYVINDIIKYYILSIERDVHYLVMCKCVNKRLYICVQDILKSLIYFNKFGNQSIKVSMNPILSGYRTICLLSKNRLGMLQTTYHYIVNSYYDCKYNYHLDLQNGIETLRLTCYDGLILILTKYGHSFTINITSCLSCFYKLNSAYTDYISIKILLDSSECRYTQRPLQIK